MFRNLFTDGKWGTGKFKGLTEILFTHTSGPTFTEDSTGKIFDVLWSGMSDSILRTTLQQEPNRKWTTEDINAYLASLLVMGLTSQPSYEDYFYQDPRGIFGSKWLQETFTYQK